MRNKVLTVQHQQVGDSDHSRELQRKVDEALAEYADWEVVSAQTHSCTRAAFGQKPSPSLSAEILSKAVTFWTTTILLRTGT